MDKAEAIKEDMTVDAEMERVEDAKGRESSEIEAGKKSGL